MIGTYRGPIYPDAPEKIWDSKAVTVLTFEQGEKELVDGGWQILIVQQGVVYLRRPFVKERGG